MKYLFSVGPGIGDIAQYLPVAYSIKMQDRNATIDFIVSSNKIKHMVIQEFMKYQDSINEIYYYSANEPAHDIKVFLSLLTKKYDYSIIRIDNEYGKKIIWAEKIMKSIRCCHLINNIDSNSFGYFFVPERIHYSQKNEIMLSKMGISYNHGASCINYEKLPFVDITKSSISRPIVGLSVGTNKMSWKEGKRVLEYDVKSWPLPLWIKLAQKLANTNHTVILLGGKKEAKELGSIGSETLNANIFNYIGRTTLGESLSLIRQCDLLVGSEGGMLHCADLMKKRIITLFGGSDYKQWEPNRNVDSLSLFNDLDCYPCFGTKRAAYCQNHKCIDKFTIEFVYKKITNYFTDRH